MFVFYWSLISPLCLGIVWGLLSLFQFNWYIASSNLGLSIVVYTGYWLLLARLEAAALFWRFQDRKLAIDNREEAAGRYIDSAQKTRSR